MAVAARRGLSSSDSLEQASRLNTDDHDDFEQLPSSCAESADALAGERATFEADGVFPSELIDAVIERLREADAAAQMKKVAKNDAAREELVNRYWHVG